MILGGGSSKITELPKATRNSPRNIQTDQSASDAIKNLVSAGFKNTPSKDGTVNVLTKGENIHVLLKIKNYGATFCGTKDRWK